MGSRRVAARERGNGCQRFTGGGGWDVPLAFDPADIPHDYHSIQKELVRHVRLALVRSAGGRGGGGERRGGEEGREGEEEAERKARERGREGERRGGKRGGGVEEGVERGGGGGREREEGGRRRERGREGGGGRGKRAGRWRLVFLGGRQGGRKKGLRQRGLDPLRERSALPDTRPRSASAESPCGVVPGDGGTRLEACP